MAEWQNRPLDPVYPVIFIDAIRVKIRDGSVVNEIDIPLGLCAEVEGLFVDLPPRPRERFTLVGCTPDGVLADLLARLPAEALGTERAWLGDLAITAPAPSPGTPPSWWGEDLGDIVVLAQRPNTATPGTVDIDLDGFVNLYDCSDAVARPGDVTEFVLLSQDEAPCGTCRDITGVFREQAAPPVPQVRLLGCRTRTAAVECARRGRTGDQGRPASPPDPR